MIVQEDIDKFLAEVRKMQSKAINATIREMAKNIFLYQDGGKLYLNTEEWIEIAITFAREAEYQRIRANRLDRK